MLTLKKLPVDQHVTLWGEPPVNPTPRDIHDATQRLAEAGIAIRDIQDGTPETILPLPDWAETYQDTLSRCVSQYGRKHITLIDHLMSFELPPVPEAFPMAARNTWMFLEYGTDTWRPAAPPAGQWLVLDFETCPYGDKTVPICCLAYSAAGWYFWLWDKYKPLPVVPFGADNLVAGWNICYDRAFLEAEYLPKPTRNRFLDGMSCHIVVRGMSNQQLPSYRAAKFGKMQQLPWMREASSNGLADVYQFHTGRTLDKGVRAEIVGQGYVWCIENELDIVRYCAHDVTATHETLKHVYPEYKVHNPKDESLTAMLLLGSMWIPLDAERYPTFYQKAEKKYRGILEDVQRQLWAEIVKLGQEVTPVIRLEPSRPKMTRAEREALNIRNKRVTEEALRSSALKIAELCDQYPQLEQLDWTLAKSGATKYQPKWFRELSSKHRKGKISLKIQMVAQTLCLQFRGEPVLWSGKHWYTERYGNLVNPKKHGKLLTQMFTKDNSQLAESGVLTSAREGLTDMVKRVMSTTTWTSMRKRVKSLKTLEVDIGGHQVPVCIPGIVPNGTITRRCADRVFQVTPNPKPTRVGTGFKTMIAAPPGYVLVGGDVASQELWLAATMGDRLYGFNGSTPLSIRTLIGNKGASTDPHSVLALAMGDKKYREIAKIVLYATLYGQGVSGCRDYLLRNFPEKTPDECEVWARDILTKFKGDYGKHTGWRYTNGDASDAFNAMEAIAGNRDPWKRRLPVASILMPKPLQGEMREFKPTRVNWVIQAMGTVFRDRLVLFTQYFMDKLGVDGRLVETIHDEIRWVANECHRDQAAYALNLAHLYTTASLLHESGLDCIPLARAYFEAVDVDKWLRKDPRKPSETPDQPGLPPGTELTPENILSTGLTFLGI